MSLSAFDDILKPGAGAVAPRGEARVQRGICFFGDDSFRNIFVPCIFVSEYIFVGLNESTAENIAHIAPNIICDEHKILHISFVVL